MTTGNADQKVFWEDCATLWVDQQAPLDALMSPVLDGVLERADLKAGHKVLDIGCGTGTSTLRAASVVTPDGHVLGADIAAPMIASARSRAHKSPAVQFEILDVAEHAFPDGGFDRVISRFGVMFFADPVAAFVNIRKAMAPGALLSMACWGQLDQNPWFQMPMYAAKERLGAPPALDPNAPGPFAFRDTDRVLGILRNAGFEAPQVEVASLELTPPGDLDTVAHQAAVLGPARRAIDHFGASADAIEDIERRVRERFARFETANGVRVPAEINFFTARAPHTRPSA
ncbi:MAG: methyltransferase domain-containing protein [Pseudomonadota bacterium]